MSIALLVTFLVAAITIVVLGFLLTDNFASLEVFAANNSDLNIGGLNE